MKIFLIILICISVTNCAFKKNEKQSTQNIESSTKTQKNKIILSHQNGKYSSARVVKDKNQIKNITPLLWKPENTKDNLEFHFHSSELETNAPSAIEASVVGSPEIKVQVELKKLIQSNGTELHFNISGIPYQNWISQYEQPLNLNLDFYRNMNDISFSIQIALQTTPKPTAFIKDAALLESLLQTNNTRKTSWTPIDIFNMSSIESDTIVKIQNGFQGKLLRQININGFQENIRFNSIPNSGGDWKTNDCLATPISKNELIEFETEFALIPFESETHEYESIIQHSLTNPQMVIVSANTSRRFILFAKINNDRLSKPMGSTCFEELRKITTGCQRLQCIGGYFPPKECYQSDVFACPAPWNTANREDSRFCAQWNTSPSQYENLSFQYTVQGIGYKLNENLNDNILYYPTYLDSESTVGGDILFNNNFKDTILGILDFNHYLSKEYPQSCTF